MADRGLNEVKLIGRVGQDPDIRYTSTGKAVCNLSIATTESWKDRNGEKQERTEWHKVEAWEKLAEIIDEYVNKGDRIYISGQLRTDQWEDQEGNTRYTTKITAKDMIMLGSGKGNGSRGSGGGGQRQTPPTYDESPF